MVSGPEIIEGGAVMSSSSMSSGGVMVNGPSQPFGFMGQAQRMPQSEPSIYEEPPTN